MDGKQLDFSDSLFSPSNLFGTSPAQPMPNPALGVDTSNINGLDTHANVIENPFGDGELDIEALLNQIAAADGVNGFSLDAFLASTGEMPNGTGDGMDMMGMWDGATHHATGSSNHDP
jgi:hypothetical protein